MANEKKYKIVALSVNAGIGNKIYESGEVISESGFAIGSINELIEGGWIKPFEEEIIEETDENKKTKKK
jgi:hypothetical protein